MSPTFKAAAAAAVVFLAIVLGYFALRSDSEPGLYENDTSQAEVTPAEPAELTERNAPPEPVRHDAVRIVFEVRDERGERNLPGSSVRVNKAHEGNRVGEKVWESSGSPNSPGIFEHGFLPGAYIVRGQCSQFSGTREFFTVVDATPQTVVLRLNRGNTISGRILDLAGKGIGGARVLALKELGNPEADMEEMLFGLVDLPNMTNAVEAETESDPDGSYQLDGLKPEWYTVRALAAGYTSKEIRDVPAPREKVDLKLPEGTLLTGVVLDAGGSGVANAEIRAFPHVESQNIFDIILSKSRPPLDQVTSDGSGNFQFETLGVGTFNFLITASGYQPEQVTRVPISPEGSEPLRVKVKPGLAITGFVQDPDGNPVTGARVRAQRMGGAAASPPDQVAITFNDGSVETDETGSFNFDSLEDGKHSLLCWHPDFKTMRRQPVFPDKGGDIVIKLTYGGRVTGVVRAEDGTPVPGARIAASDVADVRKETVTDAEGYYVLPGVLTGRRPVTMTVNAKGYSRARREIRLTKEEEISEDFELQGTSFVHGLVTGGNNEPVFGARVMVKKFGGSNAAVEQTAGTGLTNRQGRFEIADVESSDRLWVVVKKGEYLDERSEEFTVVPGESFEAPTVILRLGGAIAGTVVSSGGRAIPGAMVTVRFEGDTDLTMQGNPGSGTNANGEYRIQGLDAGIVDLVVKAPHFPESVYEGVEVREGSINAGVQIQLEQGNSVAGRVTNTQGDPVRGAAVIVRDFTQGVQELRGRTDGSGGFLVEGILSAGSVEIEINSGDYATYVDEDVSVGSDDLAIVLKELGKLVGVVTDDEGNSITKFTIHPQYQSDRKDPRKDIKPKTFSVDGGEFEFGGVAAGLYTVQVGSPSFAAATLENISVSEGEAVDLGTIQLARGGVITGRVVDPLTGEPVSQVRVQVVQGQSRFLSSQLDGAARGDQSSKPTQVTDADGNFMFSNLRGGELSLRVTKPGYSSQVVEAVNPDIASSSRDLEIEFSKGGEITGTVTGAAGNPQRRMPIYLIGETQDMNQSTNTDSQGRFRFSGVASGNYTVKAHKFVTGQGYRNQAEVQVDLKAGGRRNIRLVVQ